MSLGLTLLESVREPDSWRREETEIVLLGSAVTWGSREPRIAPPTEVVDEECVRARVEGTVRSVENGCVLSVGRCYPSRKS